MLEITIEPFRMWSDTTEEFINVEGGYLQLEHSLISLSKWESKWHKSFLKKEDKSMEEILDYIRCMTLNKGVKPDLYRYMPAWAIKRVTEYIEDPMTATTINSFGGKAVGSAKKEEIITSEVIYAWMVMLGIPMECEKWHLNRLMMLIRVVEIKSNPKKNKVDKKAAAAERARLNKERRRKWNTKG